MIDLKLTENAASHFYSDPDISGYLYERARLGNNNKIFFNDCDANELPSILIKNIDRSHPGKYRTTDLRSLIYNSLKNNLFASEKLPWIDEISSDLLQKRGDIFYYREDRVQTYARLSSRLDPTFLVSYMIFQWCQKSDSYLERLEHIVSAHTPFFSPPCNPSRPFAEGHVHYWGVSESSQVVDQYILYGAEFKTNSQHSENQDEYLLIQRSKNIFAHLLFETEDLTDESHYPERQLSFNWSLIPTFRKTHHSPTLPIIAHNLKKSVAQKSTCRWIWIYLFFIEKYNNASTSKSQRMLILSFWQSLNSLRNKIIMNGQGLTRFVEDYFDSELRKKNSPQFQNVKNIHCGLTDVAEIKSGINKFTPDFASMYCKGISESSSTFIPQPPYIFGEPEISVDWSSQAYLNTLERWHYCGHFFRSPKNLTIAEIRQNIRKNAYELISQMSSLKSWNRPEFLGGQCNPNFDFHPSNWYRGLDVAGDENEQKIELFAPTLRWLRSGCIDFGNYLDSHKGFHLSIHAGEDYAHPISGMRHIDETVRFCEMTSGDRIGHGLAIGIEPSIWMQKHGEAIVPVDEHLDNLVWLWHYATILSSKLDIAARAIPILERRISRFLPYAGWYKSLKHKNFTIDPSILFRAWNLRRNCPHTFQKMHGYHPLSSRETVALPDFELLNDGSRLEVIIFFERYSFLENLSLDLFSERPPQNSKIVIVETENSRPDLLPHIDTLSKPDCVFLRDIDTSLELELMYAVQDYQLNLYDSMGIILEANPTSNVYIAKLNHHGEHPVFRWHPPDMEKLKSGNIYNRFGLRNGPVSFIINTDDPGIMPTTLRTEYHLLRAAAIDKGISKTTADRWLEYLREFAIQQFHKNHIPVFLPRSQSNKNTHTLGT